MLERKLLISQGGSLGDCEINAEKLYLALLEKLNSLVALGQKFELVGLASGGAWIAERLARDLNFPVYGVINVSFHRDDYAEKGVKAFNISQGMSTHLPFPIDNSYIVLVDDVLDTGRTVRAALNELFDYGRPARVDLAVLIDRHRRELPIDASFKGASINVSNNQALVLEQTGGCFSFVYENK